MDDSVTVTFCENGPLLIRGPYTLLTQEGAVIEPGRATVALCRCGRSSSKPFCDGSHKRSGFRAASEPDAAPQVVNEADTAPRVVNETDTAPRVVNAFDLRTAVSEPDATLPVAGEPDLRAASDEPGAAA